ncbi:DUF3558 domain-containing protein [Streptomyces cucumeris]|uniref:DUF3558 domain-containing protein n=1 Tax=Streptomyces cucumeris TaxID=2962890 RepID=UPI0020C8EC10|nr:DUF3558 domain-containing protein [Streptomyces sp. NEAU-Y11]MCP9210186.1 DUF3558 domain-containing protein [Streptomyces sp. NEAU-Y11]
MQPAQRRAYGRRATPAVAVLIGVLAAVGLSGCTGSGSEPSGDDGSSDDAGRQVSAEPGRYTSLPEACSAVSAKTLQTLLPGGEEEDKAYEGQAALTFDIDRRDGCRWKMETSAGTRYLTLDFERVVSYDPAVSDDDRAQESYEEKAVAAHIPDAPSSPAPTDDGSDTPGAASDDEGGSGDDGTVAGSEPGSATDDSGKKGSKSDEGDKTPKGDESPESEESDESAAEDEDSADTAPRRLDDLADDAFLNDQLITKDSGVHRDITVVFRSSNVIATIRYNQWSTDKKSIPDSEELQENAEDLAQELTDTLNE